MPWAAVNGTEIYYEEHGQGPAVVFAHGAGGNHLSWWQQVPAFSRKYRCVVFDHRAFGRSPNPEAGPGRRAFAQDLTALLDHLGIDTVSIVAQSMGGRTAAGFALTQPARLRALVLAGTHGGCVNDAIRERQREQRHVQRRMGGLMAAALGQSTRRRRPDLAFLYESIARLNPPRARDFLAPPKGYRGSTAPALAALGRPLLFIVGEEDAITPPDVIRMAHEMVPGSRYVELPGAGHSAYFERADDFNREVLRFLDDVAAAP